MTTISCSHTRSVTPWRATFSMWDTNSHNWDVPIRTCRYKKQQSSQFFSACSTTYYVVVVQVHCMYTCTPLYEVTLWEPLGVPSMLKRPYVWHTSSRRRQISDTNGTWRTAHLNHGNTWRMHLRSDWLRIESRKSSENKSFACAHGIVLLVMAEHWALSATV